MPQELQQVFTLHVDLSTPLEFGNTFSGDRRFIPITGGVVEDASGHIVGKILSGGGDWNAVRSDGVVHVLAKYTIQLDDGTLVNITNEGYGRASQATMSAVFGNDPTAASMADGGRAWYTKTWPRFEVAPGKHDWLNKACFVGNLLPPREPNYVKIEVYQLL
ncbi:hypothetical protein Micbo1qcDRAFT_186690 [Microdochium bolleyi]|uniref:Uncharacterized protein n=1 Tax=Microdochium bolleyi TaxID=196109 RepID=A0A136IK48_9PEZI|nr:hypothetical protein Micbo1qcDRAFT_186690 [Microdochium bolleyi]